MTISSEPPTLLQTFSNTALPSPLFCLPNLLTPHPVCHNFPQTGQLAMNKKVRLQTKAQCLGFCTSTRWCMQQSPSQSTPKLRRAACGQDLRCPLIPIPTFSSNARSEDVCGPSFKLADRTDLNIAISV